MKKQIRSGVFETNSSSVHAICISTGGVLNIPEKINFYGGSYGWEYETLDTVNEKASYLYSCIASSVNSFDTLQQYIRFIVETLKEVGVKYIDFEPLEIHVGSWGDDAELWFSGKDDCYVDHGSATREFVEAVCTNKDYLLNYLFDYKSYVLTGNDNEESPMILASYPHEEFYKYN